MLSAGPVPHPFSSVSFTPHQQAAAATFGALVVASVAWVALRRPHPTAEAIEQARRERLARVGRITDGSLVDTATLDGGVAGEIAASERGGWVPRSLLFRYRIAGVAYEAVQDVSALPDQVRDLRIDLPVQVRYDHDNPADSIVVAENWNGLRFATPTKEAGFLLGARDDRP